MSFNNGKKYGLIIPNKKPTSLPLRPSVSAKAFTDNSDDEEDSKFKQPTFDVKLETIKASLRKTTKIHIENALEEDASVFMYDEVYDEIRRDKSQDSLSKNTHKLHKPKYVGKLLQASAVRKLEKELLSERKAQRELEEEKDKYGDKESFVTGAYKEKMAEIRLLVEQRQKEEEREDVMDVTKQDGLGGFYRYMFQQKTSSNPPSPPNLVFEISDKDNKKSIVKDVTPEKETIVQQKRRLSPEKETIVQQKRRLSPTMSPPVVNTKGQSSHEERLHDYSDYQYPHHQQHKGSSQRHRRSPHQHSKHGYREKAEYSSSSFRRKNRCEDNVDQKERSSRPNRSPRNRSRHSRHRRHSHDRRRSRGHVDSSHLEPQLTQSTEKKLINSTTPPPAGFILAKRRTTTEEDLQAARERYLTRKASGINRPVIVLSDDEI